MRRTCARCTLDGLHISNAGAIHGNLFQMYSGWASYC